MLSQTGRFLALDSGERDFWGGNGSHKDDEKILFDNVRFNKEL
jgi:hypothetical protein